LFDLILTLTKLENCLVDAEWRVRIVDFGYSCRTEPKALLSTRCGTPHYAAPELFWGKPFAGRPADVWSFGVMVFAMSTGELPFFSPHDTVAVRYAWPHTSQASPQLRDCVAQLLVEEPADRLASHRVLEHPWFN
jgi:serine/threonine protein kinase